MAELPRLNGFARALASGRPSYSCFVPPDIEMAWQLATSKYDGVVIEGDLFPSTETDVHLAHYRRRPDVNAIVHTESPWANMFGAVGKTIDPVLLNMVLYAKGAVRIMPFEFSTNTDFGELSAALMGDDTNAVVWGNHGMISVGEDVAGAFKVAVAVEANAQVLHGALALGTPNILQLENIVIPEGARLP